MEKIAYFDSSHEFPEEIISAAGFTPYKILGNVHVTNESSDKFLPAFFCPAAKSWLTEALKHSKDWSGIIFAQGCNTTNRHFDVWKLHVSSPFYYWLNCPMKDNIQAGKFFKREMFEMIKKIQSHFGVDISTEKLQQAIMQSNEIKTRLQHLSSLRSFKDIPNRDYLEIIKKSMQLPKKEVILILDEAIIEWNARAAFPAGTSRFFLTGSDVTYEEWMDTLDECHIRIIRDDLSIGERYFTNLIPEKKDPLDALVEYYFNVPRPATKPAIQQRIDNIFEVLDETQVEGVISQNLKFCEPFAYDSVIVNNSIREKGYRLIHLEREFTPVKDQQIVNRLNAFTEMLQEVSK